MIRLAAVLPSFAGGGAERVTLTLLAGLDRSRFAPQLILLSNDGPLASAVPADIPVAMLNRPRLRQSIPRLIAALRAADADVVFSSLGYVNLALAATRGIWPGRLILREANLPSLSLPRMRWPRLMRLAYSSFYPRADLVIGTSRRMVDELSAFGVATEKLTVLPNPVDLAALRARAPVVKRSPGSGLRLVAAGRLTMQKGFDRLIPLLAGIPDLHLTILGEGPQRGKLEALAAANRVAVDLPGYVSDAPERFAGADLVVLSSRWEGMPNVALEALAAGAPVLATPESGGIAEVAAIAASGAVSVVPFGPAFRTAITAVSPQAAVSGWRASLLPQGYTLAMVNQRFSALLQSVKSSR